MSHSLIHMQNNRVCIFQLNYCILYSFYWLNHRVHYRRRWNQVSIWGRFLDRIQHSWRLIQFGYFSNNQRQLNQKNRNMKDSFHLIYRKFYREDWQLRKFHFEGRMHQMNIMCKQYHWKSYSIDLKFEFEKQDKLKRLKWSHHSKLDIYLSMHHIYYKEG